MAAVRVLVLRAPGINCDEETALAWELAGATTERIHVNRLVENTALLDRFQILTIPGGFSYGDDIAAGRILGTRLHRELGRPLAAFVASGRLILGICNGFQVLLRAGLLPGADCPVPVTLALNESGRYQDRWVRLRVETDRCPLLIPGETLSLPIGHAEGRFLIDGGESALAMLKSRNRIALTYASADGSAPQFPDNPNGSTGNIAGLIDSTGRVLGLMPHPDRNFLPAHAPHDARPDNAENSGRLFFERAVRHFA